MNSNSLKCSVLFDYLQKQFENDGASVVKKINGIISFRVKGDDCEGIWVVDCKNGNGSVEFGSNKKASLVISIKDKHILKILMGRLKPKKAVVEGKIIMTGNLALALKLKDYKYMLKELRSVVESTYPDVCEKWTKTNKANTITSANELGSIERPPGQNELRS